MSEACLLFLWQASPIRVYLAIAESQEKKMQNSYNLLLTENFFTKAMKEEIENKKSQELSGLSVCAMFPFALYSTQYREQGMLSGSPHSCKTS